MTRPQRSLPLRRRRPGPRASRVLTIRNAVCVKPRRIRRLAAGDSGVSPDKARDVLVTHPYGVRVDCPSVSRIGAVW
jgi:hypothetical protein